MTITKFGHSCFIIKEGNLTVLFDPGNYTADAVKSVTGLNAILITDEHPDHCDIASIETLREHNPGVRIITQKSVQKILADKNIPSETVLHKESITVNGTTIEGCGEKHALLHSAIPPSDNTGYMIAEKFFYPGDALTLPEKPIEILALPVTGPWVKMSESIDYAIAVKPKTCIPVHDGRGAHLKPFVNILQANGINFVVPEGEMNV